MSNLRIQVEDQEDDRYVNADASGSFFPAANSQTSSQGNREDAKRRPATPNVMTSGGDQTLEGRYPLSSKSGLKMSNKGSIKKISFAAGDIDQSEVSSSAAWLDAPPLNGAQPGSTIQHRSENSMIQDGTHAHRINTLASASENDGTQQLQSSSNVERPSSRRNFQAPDSRVAFETFDSSLEERREEKLVFKFIQRMDFPELKSHLDATKDKFNVVNIYDKSGYSPLHYAAYKNIEKACEILVNFILLEELEPRQSQQLTNGGSGETGDQRLILERNRKQKRQVLKSWLNAHSRGDDGFIALHFAAFHGNMSLIRLLIKHGSDINAQNRQGINMLHVSAQGDQPVSLAYFLEKGLSINSMDLRMSTPLHWAAFSGAELTLNYIIAWGGDLNAQDSKGLTPLHLAVKSYKENRSTKGIKQLLIKGADRNALDFETRKPIDYVPVPIAGERVDPLAIEIRKLLRDEWSILGDCLMIKNTFKKQKKSSFTLICYFLLMGISFGLLEFSSYKLLRVSGHSEWLLWTSQSLFGAAVLLCIIVWLSDPGRIKKDEKLNFVALLDTLEASSLCPDCEVIRTPRCRHCTLCGFCVDRYDHHCPWVNNCIGKGNYAQFYIFVLLQSLYLFSVVVVSTIYFKLEFIDDIYEEFEDREMHPWHKYRRAAGILISLIAVLFMFSVLFLCWLQTGNLMKGETTCERFAKTNYKKLHAFHQEAMSMELSYDNLAKKRLSIMSIDDNTNPSGMCCGNMAGMCCQQKIMDQKEILKKTQDAYQILTYQSCEERQATEYSSNGAYSTQRTTGQTAATTPLITKSEQTLQTME